MKNTTKTEVFGEVFGYRNDKKTLTFVSVEKSLPWF